MIRDGEAAGALRDGRAFESDVDLHEHLYATDPEYRRVYDRTAEGSMKKLRLAWAELVESFKATIVEAWNR